MTPAEQARREVLGDAYVDRVTTPADASTQAFQDFVTERAWGEWTRPELSRRDRSLLTIGVLAALAREHELAIHLRGATNNGITDDELDEALRHLSVYAGMPAALVARRALLASRVDRD